jgi:Ca2+-binding RTX toxin-like protein
MPMNVSALYNAPAKATQYATPTTGQTVAANAGVTALILNPAGTLATLTVTVPPTPVDGQTFAITTSQIITALTMNGGTIILALSTLALGGFGEWVYAAANSTWNRIG